MKPLNLIKRYFVFIIKDDNEYMLSHCGGVEKVFFLPTSNVTITIINIKPKKFIELHQPHINEILYNFPLSELDGDEKHPNEFHPIIDEIKEKLNWDDFLINTSIGLFKQGHEHEIINKFSFRVNHIDDALHQIDYYCEDINTRDFDKDNVFIATIDIETQLSELEIKELLKNYII